ncbi:MULTISPECIES: mandelate racemase/muconate lactonizing enzyme family protein [Rhodomicrobium]|uniref:mandelate racemase/muconate lactonizing enzyme family protein n=1 Tax=Rhodomicrobium TaxID=1068 RepID=UPI000B4BACD4|nr:MULTISPECIES: mandelate racemase/muconate lactonizing enzyme family protein [Rhodomicrobium]
MVTIKSVDAIALRMPFDDFYAGPRPAPRGWTHFETVLVRVESTDGAVGWGEAFAYSCARAVHAAVTEMVAPLVAGRSVEDIPALNFELQKRLHIQGRYGITIFAISGLDIALWDLAAKRAGKSLADHLGGAHRDRLPAYASLVRYGAPGAVEEIAGRAAAEGYPAVKLHEPDFDCVAAGRSAVGASIGLMTDVNCAWTEPEAAAMISRLKPLDMMWVEEPVFPPDDYEALRRLSQLGVPLAAGENACTALEFSRLTGAVAFPQPSVIKAGGVSEFLAIAALATAAGKTAMPHSPYFGPGYWATLQLGAHLPETGFVEFLYTRPDAWIGENIPLPEAGHIAVPPGPGIGFTPDAAVLDRYRLS